MSDPVQIHYQRYPYPSYPLIASVKRCDTFALNLHALWARFNRTLPPPEAEKILIAGCGTFAPYPWAVANPDVPITAMDLSARSLRRAHWHCLLHGKLNVDYRCGDLSDQGAIEGHFGLIDSFGVLHHLEDPLAGLKALERRLVPGGILRIMLYSRYARREEESIRRAFRLLGIDSPRSARRLFNKASAGSRLGGYLAAADETATDAGIADALLHPRARTYRIDDLLEMIDQAGLRPLLFAHPGALEDVAEEIGRLRALDKVHASPGNFVLYLGRNTEAPLEKKSDCSIKLNPCLTSSVSLFKLATLRIPARIGHDNPPLGFHERRFLRAFTSPVSNSSITGDEAEMVAVYKRALFLLEYSP
ncbi:MAG: class I SAM-dependent methyltransferase [Desulfuromonadaceae bacterium]|nr:class I SAM-dependent methyltransferase [Desulfuromonadaceae bacterium]